MRGALAVLNYDLAVYRRTWRGTVIVSFVTPLLFLGAMGIGLGTLVNRSAGGVGGVPYLTFLAPGLLAATAMQAGAGEMTFPIMAKVYWNRIYEAMLATPVGVSDIVFGELLWLGVRILIVAVCFGVVMALFGLLHSAEALLAIPAAVLTGLAFGLPIFALMVNIRTDSAVSIIFRFLITPLFLFSGTFFPISRLPAPLQAVAWISPLTHGVALTRGLVLGSIGLGAALLHTAVLAVLVVAGAVIGRFCLGRRLQK